MVERPKTLARATGLFYLVLLATGVFAQGFVADGECHPECQFPQITTLGDSCGIVATGTRNKVENG